MKISLNLNNKDHLKIYFLYQHKSIIFKSKLNTITIKTITARNAVNQRSIKKQQNE